MAQIRQEISILNVTTSAPFSGDENSLVQLDTTQYDAGATYYFEVVAKVTGGTGTVALERKGTSTQDATVSITATTETRVRSTSFTPPAGQTEYQINGSGGTNLSVQAARIIIIQNASPITKTETQIEIGDRTTKSNTTDAVLTRPLYWLFDTNVWDGTKTFYAEVTYLTSNSKTTVTVKLQEDDGSFGSWTDKVTIVSAGASTTATRVRSSSFTPTTGRNYRIVSSASDSMNTYSIYNAKIIVQQTGNPTKIEAQYYIFNNLLISTGSPTTTLTNRDTLFDPAEWVGVTNVYLHEGNASSSSFTADLKLQTDPNGTPADVTGSDITDCIQREQSSAMTMPASSQTIDSSIFTSAALAAEVVNSTRILVQVSIDATASSHSLLSMGVGL